MFRVVWLRTALDELARAWTSADTTLRQAITAVINTVDHLLGLRLRGRPGRPVPLAGVAGVGYDGRKVFVDNYLRRVALPPRGFQIGGSGRDWCEGPWWTVAGQGFRSGAAVPGRRGLTPPARRGYNECLIRAAPGTKRPSAHEYTHGHALRVATGFARASRLAWLGTSGAAAGMG